MRCVYFANPYLKAPAFDFVKWAFSTIRAGSWHPLTWISYSLDYAVWGMNPLGYHLTNIILHAVNTCVVVLLAIKLLDAFKERSITNEQSFLNGRAPDRSGTACPVRPPSGACGVRCLGREEGPPVLFFL
jgi:hypothetical protein